ncbi:MAG: isoaspartyl peptidase/L-asparaginase, partial [Candidatus Thermoplasmatota archaeon]|nr:isoaspartyl peptidase/L-asparaginase [Candidatus Thermoplasmatota archaeon]
PRLEKYCHSSNNGSAMDRVVQAVVLMEDDPVFNAGTGSVRRIDGSIQMDAAVMEEGRIGSVAAIERVKNPVLVAKMVKMKTPHVILSGDGATSFARSVGFPEYDPSTERTDEVWKKTLAFFRGEKVDLPPRYEEYRKFQSIFSQNKDTVGAVARVDGKFAAAVSTGGSSPMMRGRIGDSPLPGAGIYAGSKGAVVATGIGEEIIRRMLSFRIYEQIGNGSLKNIVKDLIEEFGDILAGVIAVSDNEQVSMANSNMATYCIEE